MFAMMSSMRLSPLAFLLGSLCLSPLAVGQTMAQDPPIEAMDGSTEPMAPLDEAPALTADELKFFESKIRPILIANCYGCHSVSGGKSKGGLRLDTRDAMLRGGKSGPTIVAGDLDSSLLIRAVRYDDPETSMPPDGALKADEIKLLEQWVSMGAPDPRVEAADTDAASQTASPGTAHRWSAQDIADGKSRHWSYKPVVAHTAPEVNEKTWPTSAIDAFLLAEMERKGLTHANDASSNTLLRRASFDLTGLPPSASALATFSADTSPEAFARAIDVMLASPQFGERWGRHWLDVARYAESSGKESNIAYPHAWRYRDYVINAFNTDKPFDRFLVEQLAGDLLPAATDAQRAEQIVATGYLAVGTKSHNGRGKPQFQMDLADEQLDATTQGMLGLTVACARCHDHKFDPIPQKDYYAVAGIFLSTDTRYGTFEAQGNNHPAQLIALPAQSGMTLGATMPQQQRNILATAAQRADDEAAKGEALMAQAIDARRKGEDLPADLQQKVQRARAAAGLSRNIDSLESRYDERGAPTDKNLVAMGAVDRSMPLNARVLDRGELDKPTTVVHRGYVQVLSDGDEAFIAKGSGRLELAEWIADDANPLTARVWVNRVWLHLFGKGLVATPDNFGMSGQTPTNPELLDHLATRLIANKWSTKQLIREIMLTRAYGMSSAYDAKNAEIDPDNDFVWRMPQKRLEAEALRDSMLVAAGLLDPTPRNGSPVNFTEGGARGPAQDRIFATAAAQGSDNFRSVYLPVMRDKIPEALEVFDFAESAFVTGQRDTTNVPTQALFLMNSAEIARMSDAFAQRVVESSPKETEQIAAAFMIALGRTPSPSESRACRQFIDDFRKATAKDAAIEAKLNPPQNQASNESRRGQNARERIRERMQANNAKAATAPASLYPAYSALCQALFLSGEFRTVD